MPNTVDMNQNITFDILYIVDLKHRDLPIARQIGRKLKNFNYKVGLCNGAITYAQISKLKPQLLIIPKGNWNPVIVSKCILNSIKVVVIETEGNPQDKFFKANVLVEPDLHLFWNHEQKKIYKYTTAQKIVLGNPRTDLLIQKKSILEKNCTSLHQHKYITIATASQDTHYSPQMLKNKAIKRKRSVETSTDYCDVIEDMLFQREIITNFLMQYAQTKLEHKIYLKPHPHEAYIYWQELINQINDSRIQLMLGEPIETLLSLSTFHIAYAACSTAAEALLMQIPVLQLRAPNSKKNYNTAHLDACHFYSSSSSQLLEVINSTLGPQTCSKSLLSDNLGHVVDDYTAKYFYIADGNRAGAYSDCINNFMLSKSNGVIRYLSKLPRYCIAISLVIISFFRSLRNSLRSCSSSTSRDFESYSKSLYDHHIEEILSC